MTVYGLPCPECGEPPPDEQAAANRRCVLCLAERTDLGLRVRLFVDGELIDEHWLRTTGDEREIGSCSAAVIVEQGLLVDAAAAAGRLWLVEVYDPAMPCESAYQRYGTDRNGMIAPTPIVIP